MDPRLSVLLDLLREIGEGDPARGVARALDAHPKLWVGVPRDAMVALPWEETQLGPRRFGAGADCRLPIDISGGRPKLTVAAVWVPELARPSKWAATALSGHRRSSGRLTDRRSPVDEPFASAEEGQRWCDAALLAAGWVLL